MPCKEVGTEPEGHGACYHRAHLLCVYHFIAMFTACMCLRVLEICC